jgi:hypothetical protein
VIATGYIVWYSRPNLWVPSSGRFLSSGGKDKCPLWVDAVDKVDDEQRAGNNRIQVPSFLNRYCAPDSHLDSMLLTRPSKNVYRQHRSFCDIGVLLRDVCC